MAEGADDDDKTQEPTQHKLRQAREKGDIIYSSEVGAALSLAATAAVIAFMSGPIVRDIAHSFVSFLSMPDQYSTDPSALRALASSSLLRVAAIMALAGLALVAAALASRYLQDQPTFTAQRLNLDLSKLDPVKGVGRMFGKAAFSAFTRALTKLAIVGACLVWALWPRDSSLARMSLMDPGAFLPYLQSRSIALMTGLASAALCIAIIDYVFTRMSYMKRHRMSPREVKDEMRQSEGDPHVRGRLQRIRAERSRKRMLAAVPRASVVITNPTHYAIALRYEQGETPAPICLAKGVDDVAQRIREAAEKHAIPIVEDPPLARALFATAEIDQPIPREHYEAAAKVIGVIMRLARRRGMRRPL